MPERDVVSDEAWAVIEPLLPQVQGRSRPWLDHRMVVEGIARRFRTCSPWRDLPERFGRGIPCSNGLTSGPRTAPCRGFWRPRSLAAISWEAGLGRRDRLDDYPSAPARRGPCAHQRGVSTMLNDRTHSRPSERAQGGLGQGPSVWNGWQYASGTTGTRISAGLSSTCEPKQPPQEPRPALHRGFGWVHAPVTRLDDQTSSAPRTQ